MNPFWLSGSLNNNAPMKKMARLTQLHPSLYLIQSSAQIFLIIAKSSFKQWSLLGFPDRRLLILRTLWKAEMQCSFLVEKSEFSHAMTNFFSLKKFRTLLASPCSDSVSTEAFHPLLNHTRTCFQECEKSNHQLLWVLWDYLCLWVTLPAHSLLSWKSLLCCAVGIVSLLTYHLNLPFSHPWGMLFTFTSRSWAFKLYIMTLE